MKPPSSSRMRLFLASSQRSRRPPKHPTTSAHAEPEPFLPPCVKFAPHPRIPLRAALSDKLRPLLDLRVSIRGGVHLDLVKRVMRDVTRSGQARLSLGVFAGFRWMFAGFP